MTLLSTHGLTAFYGDFQALFGVDLTLAAGETLAIIGANGAGKSTLLRSVSGLIPADSGMIRFDGTEVGALLAPEIMALGIAMVPEGRKLFPSLSVEENLMLPPVVKPGGMTVEEIYTLFPNLAERRKSQGTKLSGGEQQMLAIGRILRTGSPLLLLDEPTEGLAPVIVQKIGEAIRVLKQRGFTILLVEQNLKFASSVADRHYVVEGGRVIDAFSNDDIESQQDKLKNYLGL